MREWWQGQRATAGWWLLALGLAAALKGYFSAAATADLAFMLKPVAWVLRLVAGWRFEQNGAGEWYSLDAGIILVKACAGINFMVLSFLGWCWIARPGNRAAGARWLEWPVLLASSLILAWLVALIANASRILAIVHGQPALEQWLPPAEAHRLIGLLIYLPALNLQLVMGNRRNWRQGLLVGCALYAALMLGVPLATGNALAEPAGYLRHAVTVLAVLLPLCVLTRLSRRRSRTRTAVASRRAPLPRSGADNLRSGSA